MGMQVVELRIPEKKKQNQQSNTGCVSLPSTYFQGTTNCLSVEKARGSSVSECAIVDLAKR